jgi:hypothetical protein
VGKVSRKKAPSALAVRSPEETDSNEVEMAAYRLASCDTQAVFGEL